MLCNGHGTTGGPLPTPAAPTLAASGSGTNLPAGQYTVKAVYLALWNALDYGCQTLPGPSAQITITAGQEITASLSGLRADVYAVSFYLTAAPATVTLGDFADEDTSGGAASAVLTTKTQGGQGPSSPPTVDTSDDGIKLDLLYKSASSVGIGGLRAVVSRIGLNGVTMASTPLWDSGCVDTPETNAIPFELYQTDLCIGPNAAVWYANRMYVLIGSDQTSGSPFPLSGISGIIISCPSSGPFLGSWRFESPVPQITNADICAPGALAVINGNLYTQSTQGIMYAALQGDGTLGAWSLFTNTVTVYAGNTMCGFDFGNQQGGVLWAIYNNGGSNEPVNCHVVNPDGSFASYSQIDIPAVVSWGALWLDPTGYAYYIGGENGSGVPQTTIYKTGFSVTTGAPTGNFASVSTGLPSARSRFAFAANGGYLAHWWTPSGPTEGAFAANLYVFGGHNTKTDGGTTTSWWLPASSVGGTAWNSSGTLPANMAEGAACYLAGASWQPYGSGSETPLKNYVGVLSLGSGGGADGGSGGPMSVITYDPALATSSFYGDNTPVALDVSDLGIGASITAVKNGQELVFYVGLGEMAASSPQGTVNYLAKYGIADGTRIQVDIYFWDGNGDPSDVESTIINIGQPPTIASLSPAQGASTDSAEPTLSFTFTPGAGGLGETIYRFQVIDDDGVTQIDTGWVKDQLNSYVATETPHLNQVPNPLTLIAQAQSLDVPMNDGVSTNQTQVTNTDISIGVPAADTPVDVTAVADPVNGWVTVGWENSTGSTAVENRVYWRATGQATWNLLRDDVVAVIGSAQSSKYMDQLPFMQALDFGVSGVTSDGGESPIATGPTGITISPSYQFDEGGFHGMLHVAGFDADGNSLGASADTMRVGVYMVDEPTFNRVIDAQNTITFGAKGGSTRYGVYSYRTMQIQLSQDQELIDPLDAFIQLVQANTYQMCYRDLMGYVIYCGIDLQHGSKHSLYINHELNLVESSAVYNPAA
jgi:hypothetical protein